LHQTGGCRIPIGAQFKPGSGIFGKRGPWRARIWKVVNSKKGCFRGVFFRRDFWEFGGWLVIVRQEYFWLVKNFPESIFALWKKFIGLGKFFKNLL
jgi:hypothetical protein